MLNIQIVLVQLELKLIQIRWFNFNISVTYKVNTYNFVYNWTCDTNHNINLYVKRCQYSICIRSIKMKTNTEISFSFWLTLFYSIPLLALTHGQKDGLTEEQIHSLCVGWRNLPTLRVGWRNLFSSCAVVSVFGSGGK